MQSEKMIKVVDFKGNRLEITYPLLFQLENYPVIDEKESLVLDLDNQELLVHFHSSLAKARKEMSDAYKRKDWKRIVFIADRERDGSLCCGAIRLSFACEFLIAYYQTHETHYLDALYEQLINTIEQTIKAKE